VNGSTRLAAVAVLGGAVLLAFLALGGGALAQETDSMSLQLTPSRDSGVSGTATLTDVEGGVRVELDMRGCQRPASSTQTTSTRAAPAPRIGPATSRRPRYP
jgi:hypothetical protein